LAEKLDRKGLNLAVYEIMWKNIVEWGKPQMTVWHMRIACRIPEATNTHSEYVTPIDFPLEQWFHERASMSHCLSSMCYIIEKRVWLQLALTANLIIICIYKIPYFSIDNAHLMYNPHPKLFRHSF
jgi:hypothetical protein